MRCLGGADLLPLLAGIGAQWSPKWHFNVIGPDDDAVDKLLNQRSIVGWGSALSRFTVFQITAHRFDRGGLNFGSADSQYPTRVFAVLQRAVRNVITISGAFFIRVGGRHQVAAVIKDAAGKKRWGCLYLKELGVGAGGELGLNSIEQSSLQYWRVLATVDFSPIRDVANIKAITEEVAEGTNAKSNAAANLSVR